MKLDKYFVYSDEERSPLRTNPYMGPFLDWAEKEIENLDEDQFWAWAVEIQHNGFNQAQLDSIEKRRKINPYLIPDDFEMRTLITLDKVFQNNFDVWKAKGYVVKVR